MEVLPTALAILALAIFGPALFKAFLYFVVAPFAASRPPFRLMPRDHAEVAMRRSGSATSHMVPLEPAGNCSSCPRRCRRLPIISTKGRGGS
jgi:hypothetical protein